MPVGLLKQVVSKVEFYKWVSYYMYKEPDETELQLANIASIISAGLGNKKASVENYLINKRHVTEPQDVNMTNANGTMTDSAIKGALGGVFVKQMK